MPTVRSVRGAWRIASAGTDIRERLFAGESAAELAAAYQVSTKTIHRLRTLLSAPNPQPLPRSWLTEDDRADIRNRRCAGETLAAIALAYGVSPRTVSRLGTIPAMRKPQREWSPLRLSVREREEISRGVRSKESARSIARRLRRSPSTISREISKGGGKRGYRGWKANELAKRRARRPKIPKLEAHQRLRREVERRLSNLWSPQQIAADLPVAFPDDPSMRISHETIYQSLYVQGRGALRKELKKALRTGRARRRPRGGSDDGRGRLSDMVMISERPPEVEDRAIPGHWEGDLLIGRGGRSAVGTLVERHSRYVMLLRLPNGRTADDVRTALVSQIKTLPKQLWRSITWDQGKEMADHVRFTIESGVQVYFCDPHSPWQRGSNENTNGLLRQFLPKNADLAVHTQSELNRIARLLNQRPRQTLGWMTPSAVLGRAVAATT